MLLRWFKLTAIQADREKKANINLKINNNNVGFARRGGQRDGTAIGCFVAASDGRFRSVGVR